MDNTCILRLVFLSLSFTFTKIIRVNERIIAIYTTVNANKFFCTGRLFLGPVARKVDNFIQRILIFSIARERH